MTNTWFISDTHFGHRNILKYEPEARPFETIEEHDEELIRRWNSVVHPKDLVYHLGDVSMNNNLVWRVGQCNGRKKLIRGNHDNARLDEYLKYFEDILSMKFFSNLFIASHFPIHPMHMRLRFCVHGHLHSNVVRKEYLEDIGSHEEDLRFLNVSVEHTNLTPISLDEILEELKRREEIIGA